VTVTINGFVTAADMPVPDNGAWRKSIPFAL
jgi:hypothetical protein